MTGAHGAVPCKFTTFTPPPSLRVARRAKLKVMPDPSRAEVDALPGTTLLEFGAEWCPICQAARPLIDEFVSTARVRHLRVEDGKGKALGRSFRVKLWPTLIVLRSGQAVARAVRPHQAADLEPLREALSRSGA